MLTCPMCKKTVPGLDRQCPTCRTDLSLLVDYVGHLQDGLAQAEALTRAGELGEAVWTYLEVLEVDPDNATARRQVGQVVAAVRHFDRTVSGRRWLRGLQRQAQHRHAAGSWIDSRTHFGWISLLFLLLLVLGALVIGYAFGHQAGERKAGEETPQESSLHRLAGCEIAREPFFVLTARRAGL